MVSQVNINSNSEPKPLLSVIMANHNGGRYIAAAIASVLNQSLGDLELIVSDDASTDESARIVEELATRDPRIRLLRSRTCGGPAVARNLALEAARGEWIGIVDSDDLIHPLRMERLIDRAQELDVSVVADDLVYFGANLGKTLLGDLDLQSPWMPTNADFLAAEMTHPATPVGYLKPLILRSAIGALRYRPYMTVGEDFDLLFRVLLAGARIAVFPEAYYLYRLHDASISHRLSTANIEGMERAIAELRAEIPPELVPLLEQRGRAKVFGREFAELVDALKARRLLTAARMLGASPTLARPLFTAAREHMTRRIIPRQIPTELSHLSLAACDADCDDTKPYQMFSVPSDPLTWTPARAADLIARTGCGPVRIRAHGRAGLNALGFVPEWEVAELVSPKGGWSEQEMDRIKALPWPVTMT